MDLTSRGITLMIRWQGLWRSLPTSLMNWVQGIHLGRVRCAGSAWRNRIYQMYNPINADCQLTLLNCEERWFSTFKSCAQP